MASLYLHDRVRDPSNTEPPPRSLSSRQICDLILPQGIGRLEDVALHLGEAVGGGASSGTAAFVRLAVPFNSLTSVAALAVLVATPDARAVMTQKGRISTADALNNNGSSALPLTLAFEPVFLHLVHLDVRHNKRKGRAARGVWRSSGEVALEPLFATAL
jgi:hypothetical protein